MKTKNVLLGSLLVVVLVGLGYGGWFAYQNFRGAGPSIKPPPQDIRTILNTTGMPLTLPSGAAIDVFADELPGVRVIRFDPQGNLWASLMSAGEIVKLTVQAGAVSDRTTILSDLRKPHGLTFDPNDSTLLYYATEDGLWKYSIGETQPAEKLLTFPTGGHSTRTIDFGPDGLLYISVGSSCNVCRESDPHRAAVWTYNTSTGEYRSYASGLRNSVFFIWHQQQLWATENGRDLIGDDLPPDEVNVLTNGGDYGWPNCYGQRVLDTTFDDSTTAATRCVNSVPAKIDLQAHSAPLGLSFLTSTAWPSDWQGDLIVAYHGSWNRSVPTGYKLVRQEFKPDGSYSGVNDFVTGWLTSDGALGRPVDVIEHDNALYVSDDKANLIYVITPTAA